MFPWPHQMDANPSPEPPVISQPLPDPTPWSFWPTIGFSVAIVGAGLAAQVGVVIIIVAVMAAVNGKIPDGQGLEKDGMVLAFSTAAMAPVVVGLAIFFAWLRKGPRVSDYLDLRWPSAKTTLPWIFGLLGFIVVSDTVT